MVGTIFSIAGIILLVYIIVMYNQGIGLKNYTNEAFSTMDVYLKKRWDLIPNLIECVKQYASHEKTVLTQMTGLRTKSYSSLSSDEKLDVNTELYNQIPQIIAVAENYPDLKANQNFIKLMDNLSSVENDIANARKYYNATVRELNNFLEIFPTNIIGAISGIKERKMFEISDDQRNNIKVEF